tara:strand:+ start:2767 stop:3918 length:1152 start_codon:yes stop_codon:yes gene_type:complete
MDIPEVDSLDDLGKKMVSENGNLKIKQEEPKETQEPSSQTTEKIDTPVGDKPVEADIKSSLTDIASEPVVKTTEEDDFNERFTSRLNDEGYVKREDVEKEFSEKPATSNELLSELLKLQDDGIDVNKGWLRDYLTDYSKLDTDKLSDAVKLVKEQIMKTEGLDGFDADFELEERYDALFGEYTDEDSTEYKRAMRKLSIQAKKYLSSKKDEHSKLSLPDSSRNSKNKEEVIQNFVQDAQAKQAEQQENLKSFLDNTSKRIERKLEKIAFDVDGENFDFEVSEDVKKKVGKAVRNYSSFLDENFIRDGKLDEDGLGTFFAEFYAKQDLRKLIRGKSKAEGKEQVISEDLKNAKVASSSVVNKTDAPDDYTDIGRQILNKNNRLF